MARPFPHACLGISLLASLALSGCEVGPSCGSLRDRADSCGYAVGNDVNRAGGLCSQVEDEMGQARFDRFAACVSATDCKDDGLAMNRCLDEATADGDGSCARILRWIVGCGLEPLNGDGICDSLTLLPSPAEGSAYVDCITAEGCLEAPALNERIEFCRPATVDALVNYGTGCARIMERRESCGEEPPEISWCLAEAVPFSPESHGAYVDCYVAAACGASLERIACLVYLEPGGDPSLTSVCERVSAWGSSCGGDLPGLGGADRCLTLLAPFSYASVARYSACITETDCDASLAQLACLTELEVKSAILPF